jgi:hypothetical protein
MVVGAAAGCDLLILLCKIKDERSQPSAAPTRVGRCFVGIVTKTAKSVYQNPTCLPPPHLPKIRIADKANAINNVTAPTKAVNPVLK